MIPGYIMKTAGIPVTELAEYLKDVIGITDYSSLERITRYKDIYYVYWTPDKTFMRYRYTEYNSDDEYLLNKRISEGRVPVEYNESFIGILS